MPESKPPSPRVREIFLGALETPTSSDRSTYLERECRGDNTLRSEVDAMLAATNQLGTFLEQPPAAEMKSWREGKSSEHIGAYKLLQEIGEGGCGVVYMAEQETPVRRRVALKIIKLGMDTKSVIARFESERQALAMMDHPNIAKVLDAGATENGRPYFVMELVRGVRITDYCDQHKLSTEERLRLFVLVAQAIQHAHQKGIIHRDIKPSNILVTLHDGVPVPKIIDFGIAKAVDQRLTDKTLFTEFQSFIGTPAYMSPEQAEMTGLDIDTRSDIYSLGVLLYEMLVGSTPFDPNTLRDAGLDECRRTIREDEPAKPSMRFSTLLGADRDTIAAMRVTEAKLLVTRLRGDLDWIVMKCLDKDRQRRYATANALAMDVQHYMDGDLVSARPPSTVYRLQKAWRRHRLVLSAVSAVAAALVLGIGASSWLAIRAMNAEKDATQLRVNAETNLEQSIRSTARAQLNEYVADMNVASHSLQNGNLGRTRQLLAKHLPESGSGDLRGFEWRYLANISKGDEHLAYPLQGAPVRSLMFSRDGILLAVGMDRETKIWDVRTQSLVVSLPTSGRSLAFVAGGTALVTGDDREAAKVWNTTTWTEQLSIPSRVFSMAVSADGQLLAISNGGGRGRGRSRNRETSDAVTIWGTSEWEEVSTIQKTSGVLAFSPSGSQLAIASRRGISLWDTRTSELIRTLEYSSDLRQSWMAFSPDGNTIVAPATDQTIIGAYLLNLWDVSSGRELGFIPEDPRQVYHKSTIATASWTPDSKLLITGGWDHSIQLWDVRTRKNVGALRGHQNEVWATAVNPTGETVASGGKDGEVLLWPVKVSKQNDLIDGSWKPLAFDRTGSKLAAVDRKNKLTFFDAATLSETETLELGGSDRWQLPVALSDDFGILVVGKSEGVVEIRDLVTSESRTLDLDKKRLTRLTLSPDGRYLIAEAHHDCELAWWDLHTNALLRTIEGEDALFSRDGSTVAALPSRGENGVQIWNAITGDLRLKLAMESDSGFGKTIALSPTGAVLAITTGLGDANHAIRLWDTESGNLLGSCSGHKQAINTVAFSPDGKTLASASHDSSLKLWNATTQQELLSVQRLGSSPSSLVFSPDGQWLAAGSRGMFPSSGSSELRLFHAPSR